MKDKKEEEYKIYKVFSNDGYWGGCADNYYIAKSKDEAKLLDGWKPNEIQRKSYRATEIGDEYGLHIRNKKEFDVKIKAKIKRKQ